MYWINHATGRWIYPINLIMQLECGSIGLIVTQYHGMSHLGETELLT
jgi:hypothetical protein